MNKHRDNLRAICKNAWALIRTGNSASQAFRKAWLPFTKLDDGCAFTFDIFDPRARLSMKAELRGWIDVNHEGLYLSYNRRKSSKICRDKFAAIEFALSDQINNTPGQLPMF